MKKISFFLIILLAAFISGCESSLVSSDSESAASSAQSGSYANLIVVGKIMYVINKSKLQTFSVENGDDPQLLDDQDVGFNIESLLHYKGSLFIGSEQAMYIYGISEKGIPSKTSETQYDFWGADFCRQDPLAITDRYAYASLAARITGPCGFTTVSELRVYDISDLSSPELVNALSMDSPKGLTIDGNLLFVCEAETGLKIFDLEDPTGPEMIYHFDGFKAFDVIADDGLLIVVGPEKIYEYDYSDVSNVRFLSEFDF